MPQDNAPENPTDPTDPLLGSSASHFSIPANQDSPALRDVITQIENTLTSLAPSVSDNQIPDDVVRNTLAFGGFASVSAALQTAKGTSKEKAQLLAVKLVERIVREERLSDASVVVDEVLWVVLTKKWNLGRRETSGEYVIRGFFSRGLGKNRASIFFRSSWTRKKSGSFKRPDGRDRRYKGYLR